MEDLLVVEALLVFVSISIFGLRYKCVLCLVFANMNVGDGFLVTQVYLKQHISCSFSAFAFKPTI